MSEPIIDIAEALVTALNAHAFSAEFTAVRRYLERKQLTTSEELSVTVLMVGTESKLDTRYADEETHGLMIAIHQKVGSTGSETIDPLLHLVREIHDFCRELRLAGARVIRRSMVPRYDLEALSKTRVFLAFVSVECLLGYSPPEEAP